MLSRVLEPEGMETVEEAESYDNMNHSEVNDRFVADFLRLHGPCRGGNVIDVGSGPAHIPIVLCKADPQANVIALDVSEAMLEHARRNVARAGFDGRIRCLLSDAKAMEVGAGAFEAVISNSIIHHIPNPAPVMKQMLELVAEGGTLFVRDLVRPESQDEINRLVATYAGTEPQFAQDLFAASLHAALTLEEVRQIVKGCGMSGDSVAMTSDRHWTWTWHRAS